MEIGKHKTQIEQLKFRVWQYNQMWEDKVVNYRSLRWAGFAFMIMFFFLRIFALEGFYVVTYAMCLHLLYLVLMAITPIADMEADGGGAAAETQLPSNANDEFKPFIPKMQEFVVWRSMMRVVSIAFFCTFLSFLDIPVFWPILVLYFIILCVSQLGARIKHMMKHKYVPWTAKKPRYVAKE